MYSQMPTIGRAIHAHLPGSPIFRDWNDFATVQARQAGPTGKGLPSASIRQLGV